TLPPSQGASGRSRRACARWGRRGSCPSRSSLAGVPRCLLSRPGPPGVLRPMAGRSMPLRQDTGRPLFLGPLRVVSPGGEMRSFSGWEVHRLVAMDPVNSVDPEACLRALTAEALSWAHPERPLFPVSLGAMAVANAFVMLGLLPEPLAEAILTEHRLAL